MGKAKIMSGGTDGLYQIEVQTNTDRLQLELAGIDDKITELNSNIPVLQAAALDAKTAVSDAEYERDVIIDDLNSGGGATLADVQKANQSIYPLIKKYTDANRIYKASKLELLSLQKQKTMLEVESQLPSAQAAWCADFSELLSAGSFVATLEPNGEGPPIIKPSNNGNTFTLATDGQMQPVLSSGASATWFNWAILPGWQKFKPTYRTGIITSMTGDLADITLDAAVSSAQSLDINQTATLENVPIEYMDCNGGAFEVGNRVIIEFTNQDWAQPKVIGFESNPRPCAIDNFICWPISDTAPSGWGLPSIDGGSNPINPPLGTVGGTSPWVNIQTQNYNLLRFQDYQVGNIYWKSKSSEIPILSWIGPENGYLVHTKYLSTYSDYFGEYALPNFSNTLFARGKIIAQLPPGKQVVGAAIKKTGEIYRLYIMTYFSGSSRLLVLMHADIDDLLFNTIITEFVEYEFPRDNPYNPYSGYTSSTVVAFNQSATRAAWCGDNAAYEMNIESKEISSWDAGDNISINDSDGSGIVTKDMVYSNEVEYPPNSGDMEYTTLDITETMDDFSSFQSNGSSLTLAVDYKNDNLVKLDRVYTSLSRFQSSYYSHRTHNRPPGGWYDSVLDDYTVSASHETKDGVGFIVDGVYVVEPSTSSASGSYHHPDDASPRGTTDSFSDVAQARITNAMNSSHVDFSEAYLRFIDLKSNTTIATKNGFSAYDQNYESGNAYLHHQAKFNNGSPIVFLDQSSGLTALENWIKVRPETEIFQIKYASDRYGNRHICSITQSNVPLLNYISNANLVSLLSMAGSNPRFNKIGVI